jgi:hypothetical protein
MGIRQGCTYLSAVLLLGLLANAFPGWSWAATREGGDAWRREACHTVPVTPTGPGVPPKACGCGSGGDCCD